MWFDVNPVMGLSRLRPSHVAARDNPIPIRTLGILLLLVLTAGTATALNPTKRITQYVFETWQIDDGLPVNTVTAIAATPDGYVWLGSAENLVRFDGVRFKVFSLRTVGGGIVTDLHVDRHAGLWVATSKGLVKWRGDGGALYTTREGLLDDYVSCLAEDRQGDLWVGTSAGLNRLEDGRMTAYTTRDGLPHNRIQEVLAARDGSLWIATNGGLAHLTNKVFRTYTTSDGLSKGVVLELHEDRSGSVWIGTFDGVSRLQDGRIVTYGAGDGLPSSPVAAFAEDAAGSLWIGTYGGGIARLRDGRFETFAQRDGLSNDFIRHLHLDPQGNLWIGSQGGLARLKDAAITTYTTREGLPQNTVRGVMEAADGSFWIATHGGGLSRLQQGVFTTLTRRDGLLSDIVFALYQDRRGRIWISSYNGGLNWIEDGRVASFDAAALPKNEFITSILEDRTGAMWLGTYGGGVKRMKAGAVTAYTSKDGLADDFVFSMKEGSDGSLWLGTRKGLSRFQDGKFRRYTEADTVWAVYQDRENTVWAGTDAGLIRVKGDLVTPYTTAEGLFHDSIYSILEDDAAQFWMSSDKGIFRVRRSELTELAAGTRTSVTSIAYGVADGMKTVECNGGLQPSSWRASDGRLWFATARGLAVVDPRRATEAGEPPTIVIEDVNVEGQPVSRQGSGGRVSVAPGSRQFEFHYTAPGVGAPGRVRFRYRVDAVDERWIEAGTRRTAYYTSLPPGQHRFRVSAANEGGSWNETKEASFVFAVEPHFYQTWWFYAVCGLALSSSLWAGHHLRLNRALEIERVRTRIASDLHDDIGSSLSQIAILSEVARTVAHDDAPAAQPLERIARLSRESVDAMGDIVWAIDPHRDTPAHLATRMRRFASDLLPPRGIELQFEHSEGASPRLGADIRRQVYLIFKEAVHNAVRHGRPTRVDIEFTTSPRWLHLVVRDQGDGFDPAGAREGQGIRNMRRRADVLGGTLDVTSVAGRGTSVILTVPL
jgi:ligand-binding sensor domain-containing protein/signal transduction histidine kinase